MAYFSLAQRTSVTTAGQALWEIRASSATKPRLVELGLSQNTGIAGIYGVGRPQAIGITPTTPQTFVNESDASNAAPTTTAAVAWGTGPTIPAVFLRKMDFNTSGGAGFIFVWPRGLEIPVSSSIVIWNIIATAVCDVWAVVEE